MRKKIVVHCAAGLQNIGDEALLKSFIDAFGKENDITVLCVNNKFAKELTGYTNCLNDADRRCKEIVKKCDLFVLGGGGLFQDETSVYNVFRWGRYLKIAIKYHKKTFLYSNSIGPLKWWFSRYYVASILKKTNIITLRDKESQEELKQIGVTHAKVTADAVFGLKEEKSASYINICKPYLCVVVRHWFDTIPLIPVSVCKKLNISSISNRRKYEQFVNNMAKCIDDLQNEFDLNIVMLPFMRDRDFVVSNDILKKVHNEKTHIIAKEDFGIQQYMQIIRNSKLVIGMRLHSIILAIKVHTPFVAISYSKKITSLINYLGFEGQMIDVNEFNVETFVNVVRNTFFSESDIVKHEEEVSALMIIKEKKNKEYLNQLLE